MRLYKWRDVVQVARTDGQDCEYVLKAVCTHLSKMQEDFKSDWIPDENAAFHTEKMDRNDYERYVQEQKNHIAIKASKTHRRLVGLQLKKTQEDASLTFDVITALTKF